MILREKLWEYPKNNKPHIFTTPRPLGSGVVKIWGLLFFSFKYKIGNNDFTTILGSVNVKNMTSGTISSSNPTENVLGGSIGRTESPWTLNITPIVLTSSEDLILGSKNRFYHNSGCFWWWIPTRSGELRIEIHRIVTYIDEIRHFLTRYTHHVYPPYLTIRWSPSPPVKCNSQYFSHITILTSNAI